MTERSGRRVFAPAAAITLLAFLSWVGGPTADHGARPTAAPAQSAALAGVAFASPEAAPSTSDWWRDVPSVAAHFAAVHAAEQAAIAAYLQSVYDAEQAERFAASVAAARAAASRPSTLRVVVPGDDAFARLRQCEAGGNYATNTGNGFYGAYQFMRSTWDGAVARAGFEEWSGRLPSDAPPHVQDAAARQLHSERGFQPWPGCRARLGLP